MVESLLCPASPSSGMLLSWSGLACWFLWRRLSWADSTVKGLFNAWKGIDKVSHRSGPLWIASTGIGQVKVSLQDPNKEVWVEDHYQDHHHQSYQGAEKVVEHGNWNCIRCMFTNIINVYFTLVDQSMNWFCEVHELFQHSVVYYRPHDLKLTVCVPVNALRRKVGVPHLLFEAEDKDEIADG